MRVYEFLRGSRDVRGGGGWGWGKFEGERRKWKREIDLVSESKNGEEEVWRRREIDWLVIGFSLAEVNDGEEARIGGRVKRE